MWKENKKATEYIENSHHLNVVMNNPLACFAYPSITQSTS